MCASERVGRPSIRCSCHSTARVFRPCQLPWYAGFPTLKTGPQMNGLSVMWQVFVRHSAAIVLSMIITAALLIGASPEDDWTGKLIEAADAAYSAGSHRRALRKLNEAQSRSQTNSELQARAMRLRALVLDGLDRASEARAHEDYLARHFEKVDFSAPKDPRAETGTPQTWISAEECWQLIKSDNNFALDIEPIEYPIGMRSNSAPQSFSIAYLVGEDGTISSISVIQSSHTLLASLIIEAIAEYRVLRPPEGEPAMGCLGFGRDFDQSPDPNPPRFFRHP